MRVLLAILAVAVAPAAAVIVWARAQPGPSPLADGPHSVVWADRVFTTRGELRTWLRHRGQRYDVWARHHPLQAAILEHRPPPRTAAPSRPAKRSTPAQDRTAAKRTKKANPKPAPATGSGGGNSATVAAEIFAALFALVAGMALTIRIGRRIRLFRPRLRLPELNVRDSVANAVERLPRVRMPQRPEIRRSRNGAPVPQPPAAEPTVAAHNGSHNGWGDGVTRRHTRTAAAEPPRNGNGDGAVHAPAVVEREVVVAEVVAPVVAPLPPAELPAPVIEPVAEVAEVVAPDPVAPVRSEPPAPSSRPAVVEVVAPTPPARETPIVHPPAPAIEPEIAEVVEVVPPAAVPSTPPAPPAAAVVADGAWELCTTALWRGYVAARFWAHRPGDDVSIAQSASFDWRAWQDAPRDPEAAEAALAELLGLLVADGWEQIGSGRERHEIRFRRRPRVEW